MGLGRTILIGDDIDRAIGNNDWDEVHRLKRAQLGTYRFLLREQIKRRLASVHWNIGVRVSRGPSRC